MQVTLRSAAALAFFVLSFCDMDNWCIETRAMTAAVVSSDTVSATDSIYAASPVHSSGVAVEAKHQGTRAADPLVTSKSSPLTKKAEALRRRRITTAASVGAVLTAVLGLLVAVAKLQQCRRKLVTDTNGTTEGHTGRRLADGGDDEDDCVEEVCILGDEVSPRSQKAARTIHPVVCAILRTFYCDSRVSPALHLPVLLSRDTCGRVTL
ncbi:Toxoplasma gondii family B protein [Toxoplasma gondii TgCatPRC2]|uniref:Toxoplasma gondii family B protein n=3 Tax=Toxoplasma gondii TaxID=5811 RepID=A0A151HN46_TOXGO|nr:Toxoplasma gondii family B protein [Toxoplasma gondii ME49]EPT29815.1 Toxoplasma gondii family B protein [Toxoplasma gondii ME49]KYF40874.1 Toxoplasma gondii family B protein [Toxoplasma gondii ARI]KYK70795.1 Toxoplasma gondii family B protein [Toxoplasma gondii TgCatPRC2]|eukprot:XP_018637195.1 Toxoplasma gondii family B protein [Toxoplasma gondii ME49]